MFKKLDTTILRVRNIEEAKMWYKENVRMPAIYFDPEEKLAVLDAGEESSLTLWQIKPGDKLMLSAENGCYPIFTVEHAQKTRKILAENGVRTGDLIQGNGVVYFHFFDLDGNMLEACQVHE